MRVAGVDAYESSLSAVNDCSYLKLLFSLIFEKLTIPAPGVMPQPVLGCEVRKAGLGLSLQG